MTSALPVNGFSMTGAKPPPPDQTGGVIVDKNKEWQMELLMEKLRSKASSFKTLMETAKNIRMAMLDKRFGIDSVEKSQLQKSLDTLQHSIKVTSLQSMIERLESLSRQLGLKFMTPATGMSTELFISSDMFFLEILLEPSGAVKDVKIHHEGKAEQQSCEELVACLSRGDFVDFTAQLEGLASIYQLNADKKVKCKAFSALQSLETDLGILAQLQTFMKEPFNLVHKSPVGILEKRKGGHAMKLTYFVSPYDLIDQESKSCEALSLEAVISKKVGHSVTVCMEGSTAHKLPTSSIITLNRGPSGKSTPSYAPLTNANSSMLPACFVLKLAKKMPMCTELIRKIQKVTDLECTDVSVTSPLLSMIVQHASDNKLDCRHNKGLAVSLPDQSHCYFMTENKIMEGVLVGSIPFTHPGHVPQILNYLRQQALFNTLISSCVRPMARSDPEHMTVFEVSALSWQCISVSLEHPFEETLATAELDLSDISAVKCKLYGSSLTNVEQTSDLAGKVLQRCLSIPLTMRTLIKTWEGRTFSLNPQNGGSNNFNNSLGTGREQNNHNGSSVPEFGNPEDLKIKQEPGAMNGTGNSMSRQQQQQMVQSQQAQIQQQSFLDAGAENSIGFPSYSGTSDTPPTSTLNPLATSVTPPPPSQESSKGKKSRKRKGGEASWKSPKRKTDFDTGEILLDSSSSDSTPLGTPTSKEGARTPTPTSAGFDLSNVDPLEILSTDRSSDYDMDNEPEVVQIIEPSDRKFKRRSEDKSPSLFDEGKTLVSPSVSITPISSSASSYNSMLSSMGLERRPGIEIIPITSLSQTPLPSSITITAISNKPTSLSDERSKDRKSSKSRGVVEDVKSKLEKKRKRKRDSSPMGPPEKLPLKQDALSKPVSVSIRPSSESPPSSTSRPSSPATTLTRKFSPSPTHNNPLVLVGKSSPTSTGGLKQSGSSAGGTTPGKSVPSPRHSPVYSSPKHMSSSGPMSASVSPKHGTSSPKHGNPGKPSMSTLKSASSSPSGKTDPTTKSKLSSPSSSASAPSSSLSKDSKDKERKSSTLYSGSSPKSKGLTPKSKTLEQDQQTSLTTSTTGGTTVTSSTGSTTPPADSSKALASQQQQARNRKGSLSAVIDKLKNAQHCSDEVPPPGGAVGSSSPVSSSSSAQPAKGATDAKNPTEYMVKPSSDGMKLTINKTRAKDLKAVGAKVPAVVLSGTPSGLSAGAGTSSTGTTSGSASTKTTYTGLKPGVVAGPASRKSQGQTPPKVRSNSPLTPGTGGNAGSAKTNLTGPGQKLSSSGMKSSSTSNLLSSSGSTNKGISSKSSSPFSSREKTRFKLGDKSLSSKESENEKAFKLLAAHASSMGSLPNLPGLPAKLVVEGLIKQLDTNFQIPKLSARVNADSTDKRSTDKVDSGSKSLDTRSATPSSVGSKSEEAFAASSSALDSDMPTNLSMQPDDNLPVKSELAGGRTFLNPVADTGSKDSVDSGKSSFAISTDSTTDVGSLNLTKASDKYKSSEDKDLQQHPSFQRLSQADKKLVESITSSASVTLTPLPPPSTSSSGSSTPQEAAEMLLDFSTQRESGGGGGSKTSIPFPASASPVRKNTTPPPPPPPPPLPPPPPPSVSPALLPSSVSPISSFPASPSVSVHIVKSPAPSPRVNPLSPHSASPCITDDELMDEALVGR